jgi:hypothetical protein
MAGNVLNIKACSPLKLRSDLTGKCQAICHYYFNLPLMRHEFVLYDCFTVGYS